MSKNLNPKCKQCRRIGEKLMLKGERCLSAKCAIVKRNYPPGIHGNKGKKRLTGYGLQLQEKQKARKIYQIMEKQFFLTFERAKKLKGDLGENFLALLETRLDNVVYRMGFCDSRGKARVLIVHGHFQVNGRKVDIPSCHVKMGDVVKVKPASQKAKAFANYKEKAKNTPIPGWINIDPETMSGKVLHAPKLEDAKGTIDIHTVVEYYSR